MSKNWKALIRNSFLPIMIVLVVCSAIPTMIIPNTELIHIPWLYWVNVYSTCTLFLLEIVCIVYGFVTHQLAWPFRKVK